jgi:anti-anti-sigma factor
VDHSVPCSRVDLREPFLCNGELTVNIVHLEDRGGIPTLTFDHADLIDGEMIESIGEKMMAVVDQNDSDKLLVDLSGVNFMSSLMIGKLVLLKNRCKSKGIELKFCQLSEGLQEVFQLLHLFKLIDVYPTQADAIQAFDAESSTPGIPLPKFESHLGLAEQGDVDAQFQIGGRYAEGNGVEEDFTEALKWYHRAAEANHAEAQYALGTAYAYGMKVPNDYEKALEWFKKAADQGHIDAQYNLGMSYCHGLAGEPDHALAAQWYRRAADAGHSEAQLALADLYLEGTGVKANVDEARTWYQRAADQGSQRGAEMLEKIQQDADYDSLA